MSWRHIVSSASTGPKCKLSQCSLCLLLLVVLINCSTNTTRHDFQTDYYANQTTESDLLQDTFLIRPKKTFQWANSTVTATTPLTSDVASIERPFLLSRSKREVFRGQNYHYQRGYELSRLRFENRHPDRPKAFFVREYHQGRDVPKPLLQLTQVGKVTDPSSEVSAAVGPGGPSSLIEADIPTPSRAPSGQSDSMKTMSDDYRQRLYATKAALKAALQKGDKDLSILEFIRAKEKEAAAKAKKPDIDSHHDEQTKEPVDGKADGKDLDSINKGVLFDEQIKEDLDKIVPYDPSKPFGERIRPFTPFGGGYPTTTRRPTTPYSKAPAVSGIGGGIPGGGRPYPGAGGAGGAGGDGYLNKLRRLYPHLFPASEFDRTAGSPGGGGSGGDGGDRGSSPGAGGGGPSPIRSFTGGVGGGGAWPGSRGSQTPSSGIGGTGNGNRTAGIVPPGGSGFRSPYPSRFPGTRLSGLTLWPHIRNSTHPGVPGYIRFDYPGYSTIPYTGFRCELMPYKYGYFADVAAGCQVFHVCQKDGRMDSFLCPNGTIFHQKAMTCDWWYHVNCPSSPGFYYLNGRIGVLPFLPATLARFDE